MPSVENPHKGAFEQAPGPLGVLMLDLAGLRLSDAEKRRIADPQVGGIILFSRNYDNLEQLQTLIGDIRAVRPDLLLAVDQEGGRVQRFREGFTTLPPMQRFRRLYRSRPQAALELVKDTGWLMAAELIGVGVDISFAPVLDVDEDHCRVIADRAFSPDPREVVALAGAFISGMHEAGMAATGKHFPGHGAVTEDSHATLPIDERSYGEVEAADMQPFLQLRAQLDALMPAHIRFPAVDAEPVGFSARWLQDIIRHQMQYDGVLFSDDLSMSATESYGDYQQRAELALQAGCDMVLVCNNPVGAVQVLDYLRSRAYPPSPRLGRLRARVVWDRNQLQQLPRWRRIREQLQQLEGSETQ